MMMLKNERNYVYKLQPSSYLPDVSQDLVFFLSFFSFSLQYEGGSLLFLLRACVAILRPLGNLCQADHLVQANVCKDNNAYCK